MKKAIVVGSGAGGATVAKELQGKLDVTILEAGGDFRPFSMNIPYLAKMRKTGAFFNEKEIQLFFPSMKIRKTEDGMVLVNGIGSGGTTTLSAGNALRIDDDLKELGINLDAEFEEIQQEIPITTEHQKSWRKTTKSLFDMFQEMNLNPKPTPKMGDYSQCTHCGRCILGCPIGAKWDSRKFMDMALGRGAELITGCKVQKVAISNNRATGVIAKKGLVNRFYEADLVVLSAGGLGTPAILQNSGIECENKLFVDPVLCVTAKVDGNMQYKDVTMPFVSQKDGFILSPYFDYLSFFFNKAWRHPAGDILSIMIKLADSNRGGISNGKIRKILNDCDKEKLNEAVEICKDILTRFGVDKNEIFLGTINAGHPGGMMPLTEKETNSLHHERLPKNLYVADASLFPGIPGQSTNPYYNSYGETD